MFSKILKIFIFLLLLLFLLTLRVFYKYINNQIKLSKDVSICLIDNRSFCNNPDNICYKKLISYIKPYLLTYKVKYKGKDLTFRTLSPRYIMPNEIAADTDVMIGYGVLDNMDAEEMYSTIFNKPSFGFDCGVDYTPKNSLSHFERSCIATDKFILNDKYFHQVSSGDIHTFGEKLEELNLKNKRIIVKMDIAGAEAEALPDILKYHDNIDVIMVRFHFTENLTGIYEALCMLSDNYVPVAKTYPRTTLTLVNRKLTDSYNLPFKQYRYISKDDGPDAGNFDKEPEKVSKLLILNQKYRDLKKRLLNK